MLKFMPQTEKQILEKVALYFPKNYSDACFEVLAENREETMPYLYDLVRLVDKLIDSTINKEKVSKENIYLPEKACSFEAYYAPVERSHFLPEYYEMLGIKLPRKTIKEIKSKRSEISSIFDPDGNICTRYGEMEF